VAYVPEWEPLANALTRVMASGVNEQQAKADICNAVADRKIVARVVIDKSHLLDGGRTFSGGNVGIPPRLNATDFDWAQSRPFKQWSIGPVPPQHYTWIGGWQDRPISLIELSTADVRAVLCEASGTAADAVTTQRPGSTKTSKAKSKTSRNRTKPMQYQIKTAVTALAKEHGGKFPPDDMPVFARDRLITKWLAGGDDPVKPSTRTLREYFKQKQS
jgi:hypothetical protein